MEVLTDSEGRLRDAASKKIFLEVTLLKAIQARNTVSIDAVLKQLQQLRGGSAGTGPAAAPAAPAAATKAPPAARTPAAAAATHTEAAPPAVVAQAAEASSGGGVRTDQLWREIMEAVGRASAFTRSYLVEAFPVSFEKGVLTIGFDPEFADQLELVNNQKTHTLLRTKLQELGHAEAQIKFVTAARPEPRPLPSQAEAPAVAIPVTPAGTAPVPVGPANPDRAAAKPVKDTPAAVNTEEFKNDPLIRKALEIFKGQIVEVRA
jgi:DNA polymerase-3 subunit gamma/tau